MAYSFSKAKSEVQSISDRLCFLGWAPQRISPASTPGATLTCRMGYSRWESEAFPTSAMPELDLNQGG